MSLSEDREGWGRFRFFAGLRDSLAEGYDRQSLRADILAGVVVGIIALPLSMALAIASGAPPQHGIYTAIVAGLVIALFGGSRTQVSGPTAAFVVILAPITGQYGLGGLLVAGLMAGLILIAMGLLRFGRLIQFIPYTVTTGFTSGIAVVIATLQLKDFLGLQIATQPDHFIERIEAIAQSLPTWRWADAAVGFITLATLIVWPKITSKIPSALVAVIVGTLSSSALTSWESSLSVATIQSRFGTIPAELPSFVLPWSLGGSGGEPLELSWSLIRDLLPSALAIAMLGAIESLLSAVVADGMIGTRHDPDAELFAQGLGNVAAPFFGGIAATGAIARTGANIRSGGKSPISTMVHSLFILLSVVSLAPLLGRVPMACMAALLMMVAWNMSEARHFIRTVRIAPRSDILVQVTCFALTVVFDMVVAVGVGVVLASLLFMRRMAEVADMKLVSDEHHQVGLLPPGVVIYEVAGPMFFGAAQKAANVLLGVEKGIRVVVLDLRSVPVMDATALSNLESSVAQLAQRGIRVVLGGVQKQPLHLLGKAHLHAKHGHTALTVRSQFDQAVGLACAMAVE